MRDLGYEEKEYVRRYVRDKGRKIEEGNRTTFLGWFLLFNRKGIVKHGYIIEPTFRVLEMRDSGCEEKEYVRQYVRDKGRKIKRR